MAKKQDVEIIEIKLPVYPFEMKENKSKREIYREKDEELEERISLCNQKVSSFDDVNVSLSKKIRYENISHNLYSLILFEQIANKDKLYEKSIKDITDGIKDLILLHNSLKEKYTECMENEDTTIFEECEYFLNFQRIVENKVNKFQKKYYANIKMQTLSVCDGKTLKEVITLGREVNDLVNEFESLEMASEYFVYNSGELIVNMVNSLITSISNMGRSQIVNEFTFEYFLSEAFVLMMPHREWVTLYNKIRQVLKRINYLEAYDNISFKENYKEFERRYIVVSMENERNYKNNL